MPQHALFAACLPGLEPLLAAELRALGAAPQELPGGVAFAGDTGLVFAANLRLGTASHVLLRCAEFPCRALGELERKAAKLPWRDWLRADVPLAVKATARGSRVYHTGAAEERVANAVALTLGRAPRAAAAGDGERAVVSVRFHRDVCTISLDTAATPLHRRGYRLETAKAPLREDLAHALVLAAGFAPGQALLDPFCGSGTIAIEAAALAAGLPPGRLRPPPLRHTAMWDAGSWREVVAAAAPAGERPPTEVAASDRDAGAVDAARGNAERAGVLGAIDLRCCAVTAHPWLASPESAPRGGVVVTNPPFGVRAKGGPGLVPLYQTLGHRVQRLGDGWRLALLAHDRRLARRTGLPLRTAFATVTGGLRIAAMVAPTCGRP